MATSVPQPKIVEMSKYYFANEIDCVLYTKGCGFLHNRKALYGRGASIFFWGLIKATV